ncbi:polar growth protein [Ceratobasidium sp. 392]|nr:polar growth protein [Ceratobasidium sp. 392]
MPRYAPTTISLTPSRDFYASVSVVESYARWANALPRPPALPAFVGGGSLAAGYDVPGGYHARDAASPPFHGTPHEMKPVDLRRVQPLVPYAPHQHPTPPRSEPQGAGLRSRGLCPSDAAMVAPVAPQHSFLIPTRPPSFDTLLHPEPTLGLPPFTASAYVWVQHDFNPRREDEIALRIGDRIEVIERDEPYSDGWWRGRDTHGRVGLFPKAYTTEEPQPLDNIRYPFEGAPLSLGESLTTESAHTFGQQVDAIVAPLVTPIASPASRLLGSSIIDSLRTAAELGASIVRPSAPMPDVHLSPNVPRVFSVPPTIPFSTQPARRTTPAMFKSRPSAEEGIASPVPASTTLSRPPRTLRFPQLISTVMNECTHVPLPAVTTRSRPVRSPTDIPAVVFYPEEMVQLAQKDNTISSSCRRMLLTHSRQANGLFRYQYGYLGLQVLVLSLVITLTGYRNLDKISGFNFRRGSVDEDMDELSESVLSSLAFGLTLLHASPPENIWNKPKDNGCWGALVGWNNNMRDAELEDLFSLLVAERQSFFALSYRLPATQG